MIHFISTPAKGQLKKLNEFISTAKYLSNEQVNEYSALTFLQVDFAKRLLSLLNECKEDVLKYSVLNSVFEIEDYLTEENNPDDEC